MSVKALKTKKQHLQQPKTATKKLNSTPETNTVKTFTQHLHELRRRLFWVALFAVVAGALTYNYKDFFIELIMKPLGPQKLIYLTPGGGFAFIFTVTLYVTLILILPIILYQLYAFIRPAIPAHANRVSVKVALAAFFLMAAGVTFGYIYAVPSGLKFLTNFASDYVMPSLTADSYLNFVMGYIFGIGALFELPLLLLFWHWISPLTPKKLLLSERYVVIVAFVLAAIISPTPDAFNQTVIAIPIIIVYQFGVVAILVSLYKARKARKRKEKLELSERYVAPVYRPVGTVNMAPKAISTVVTPVNNIAKSKPSHVSVDGMVRRSVRNVPKPAPIKPISKPVVSRRDLMVPRRARLINDFGPIRRSGVDTMRQIV